MRLLDGRTPKDRLDWVEGGDAGKGASGPV